MGTNKREKKELKAKRGVREKIKKNIEEKSLRILL
jgi:hypothetical protein